MTYYEFNKEQCKKYAKLYYQKHRESILAKKKIYKKSRKEEISKYNHEYYLRVTKIKRQLTKKS